MPHIPQPSTSRGKPINPERLMWGSDGRSNVAHYPDDQLPGFRFQHSALSPDELVPALQKLENYLFIPDYFFVGEDLIGYQNFTNSRELVNPALTKSRWRILELLGKVTNYFESIGVGETFVPGAADLTNLSSGHLKQQPGRNVPYFNLDQMPTTLATRETSDTANGPFATALGSLVSVLDCMALPQKGDPEALEVRNALLARIGQISIAQ